MIHFPDTAIMSFKFVDSRACDLPMLWSGTRMPIVSCNRPPDRSVIDPYDLITQVMQIAYKYDTDLATIREKHRTVMTKFIEERLGTMINTNIIAQMHVVYDDLLTAADKRNEAFNTIIIHATRFGPLAKKTVSEAVIKGEKIIINKAIALCRAVLFLLQRAKLDTNTIRRLRNISQGDALMPFAVINYLIQIKAITENDIEEGVVKKTNMWIDHPLPH